MIWGSKVDRKWQSQDPNSDHCAIKAHHFGSAFIPNWLSVISSLVRYDRERCTTSSSLGETTISFGRWYVIMHTCPCAELLIPSYLCTYIKEPLPHASEACISFILTAFSLPVIFYHHLIPLWVPWAASRILTENLSMMNLNKKFGQCNMSTSPATRGIFGPASETKYSITSP